jgi:hypothetical protein
MAPGTRASLRRNLIRSTLACRRQIHHHGSIEAPALLDAYQRAVFG